MPYEVWAKQMAQEIIRISGSDVSTVSVVSSIPSYNTKIVNSVDELAQAYAEGWTEPYQFQSRRWILKKSK
jgi:ubiquinone biosynthesis protein UbiJ